MKTFTRYERVQGLIRNPQYLEDYNKTIKGRFNINDRDEFLQKYGIGIPLDPEIWRTADPKYIGNAAVFEDDDWIIRPIAEKPSKIINLIETKAGFTGKWDISPHLRDGRYLVVEIDLKAKKKQPLKKLEDYLDLYGRRVLKPSYRDKPDKKVEKFHIWDLYKKIKNFSKISKRINQKETTIRKAYLRAFEIIMGEKYDPMIHNRKSLSIHELSITCDKCSNRNTCDTLCPEVLAYANQDRGSSRGIIVDPSNIDRLSSSSRPLSKKKKLPNKSFQISRLYFSTVASGI